MPYGLSPVPEGDQDSTEGLLIRYRWLLAFSWLAKQNPSYQRRAERARPFDPALVSSATEANGGRIRILRTYFLAG